MHDFWAERWRDGRIGFHKADVNETLIKHFGRLVGGLRSGAAPRVLVPLCGKTVDIPWLEGRGCDVVGVEIVGEAIEAFHDELGRDPIVVALDGQRHWTSGRTVIFEADFLQLDAELVGYISAVWDRAALVAMPPHKQLAYADKIIEITPTGARMLLSTWSYDQASMDGPPWSVSEDVVRELYGAAFHISKLWSADVLHRFPRFRKRGLSRLVASTWLFERK